MLSPFFFPRATHFLKRDDDDLLLLGVAIPYRDEKSLVKIGREEFERELLVVPRIVIIFHQSRPTKCLFGAVGDERDLDCNTRETLIIEL